MIQEQIEHPQLSIEVSPLAEIYADELFGHNDDNPNFLYCLEHATYHHTEACEYILHIGVLDSTEDPPYWEGVVQEMVTYGCTQEFIDAYVAAKDARAVRVLFYV